MISNILSCYVYMHCSVLLLYRLSWASELNHGQEVANNIFGPVAIGNCNEENPTKNFLARVCKLILDTLSMSI